MIHVSKQPEPESFDRKVRQPGLRAIAEMCGKTHPDSRKKKRKKIANSEAEIPSSSFPNYWTECLDEMMMAYDGYCAYSNFQIHPLTGSKTVDHFVPKSKNWELAYEWDNYRLACSLMNSVKNNFEDVLDPFEIDDQWFKLEFVGLQILEGPSLPKKHQALFDTTIKRLKLNENPILDFRQKLFEDFRNKITTRKELAIHCPFMDRQITRYCLELKSKFDSQTLKQYLPFWAKEISKYHR
jgi:hypothetical protein